MAHLCECVGEGRRCYALRVGLKRQAAEVSEGHFGFPGVRLLRLEQRRQGIMSDAQVHGVVREPAAPCEHLVDGTRRPGTAFAALLPQPVEGVAQCGQQGEEDFRVLLTLTVGELCARVGGDIRTCELGGELCEPLHQAVQHGGRGPGEALRSQVTQRLGEAAEQRLESVVEGIVVLELLEFVLHVLNVPVLYGFDVRGDFSEAFFKTIVIPFFITVSKATVFQLLELLGDVIVQRHSKPVKLIGD
ncbi:lytic transglycosylase, putative [Babesia ovata]|uniref:Lytic transglycosylase, putative n=1 Tax=Babesia ovata TaxID=189622 RepID=A0A2H6KIN0_9APIC|nr:lytic transglycosylase, putative [Babesia ovata]GBE62839.1 lytic transglycosylase, putative [Babesia ovata]